MNSKVIMESYRNAGRKSSSLEMLGVLYNIHQKETKANVRNSFFSDMNDFSDIYKISFCSFSYKKNGIRNGRRGISRT